MGTTTTNYGLIKPDPTDLVSLTDWNTNWDTIDSKIKIADDLIPESVWGHSIYEFKKSISLGNSTRTWLEPTTSNDWDAYEDDAPLVSFNTNTGEFTFTGPCVCKIRLTVTINTNPTISYGWVNLGILDNFSFTTANTHLEPMETVKGTQIVQVEWVEKIALGEFLEPSIPYLFEVEQENSSGLTLSTAGSALSWDTMACFEYSRTL